MGCGVSNITFEPNLLCGQGKEVETLATSLNLNMKEIGTLYIAFCDMDSDASGFITPDEVANYFSFSCGKFSDVLITAFDVDHSKSLSFVEFIVAIYNVCSIPEKLYPHLIFFLVSPHIKYKATRKEVISMFELFIGGKIHTNKIAMETLRNYEARFTSSLTNWSLDNILDMCEGASSGLFTPLETRIKKIRKEIFGSMYWIKMVESRIQDPNKNDVSFMFKLRDQISSINKSTNKASALAEIGKKLEEFKRRSSVDARKKSVLLTFFHLRQDTQEDYKELRDHSYGEARRRRSLVKPNLKLQNVQSSASAIHAGEKKKKKVNRGGPMEGRQGKYAKRVASG